MDEKTAAAAPVGEQPTMAHEGGVQVPDGHGGLTSKGKLVSLYAHPWTQVILISVICFCLPGIYNALQGMGGSGQVDQTVASNANVALLSATAATALFFVSPIFSLIGPRWCFMVGGWTYALYSGSLLEFNHSANAGFVIGSGAILGIGASFLWIVQGAIMTTYVDESQKGRAIAVFWIIFNLGGGIGSFISFALNYDNEEGTVNDSTYGAFIAIMAFGWLLGLFICNPQRIRLAQLLMATETEKHSIKGTIQISFKTIAHWRVLCILPLFFSANVFYSYQQNVVNGLTFNIRTRSFNGAFYWIAQMLGGLIIGLILDLPMLSRPNRARLGWAVLFVTGFAIWGGGYAFQKWQNDWLADGHLQEIDYKEGKVATPIIFLYIFYGGYDALWQGFSYWLIGSLSNSPSRAAVLVGAYKTLQATGSAMAFRLTALKTPALTQFGMDWGLCIGALVISLPTVWTVSAHTGVEDEAGFSGSEDQITKKVPDEV